MTSIAYEYIVRLSQDCLRSILAGHFQSREIKNAQLAACYSSFSSKSMCKTITVDGERKGVRGDKCGNPTSNSLSFSITKSVATKHRVDVTSSHIARGCWPMLQLHYRTSSTHARSRRPQLNGRPLPPIGRMDSAIRDERSGVCVGGGGTGRRTCQRAHLPPVPARVSHHAAPLPRGGDSRGPVRSRNTDGRVGSSTRWSPAFDCRRR